MTSEVPDILDEIACLIADGLPVDWAGLLTRFPDRAAQLRDLMRVEVLRRGFEEAAEVDSGEPPQSS
ncbi:MAG: hypothetical protein AAB011_02390 [Candidatus Eisenbacteria bacterium]